MAQSFSHAQTASSHAWLIIIFSFFACISVSLRLLARRIQNLALSVSDYTIILGLVLALVEAGINVYSCCFPDAWETPAQMSPEYREMGMRISFISPIVWVTAVTTIRASIVSLYIHIFPTRRFRHVCYGVLAFNMVFLATTILGECLICQPLSYRWDYSIKGGSCGNDKSLSLYIAIVNVVQDFIIVVLPMRLVWRLQLARIKKLAVSSIFGLGIAICVVTSYRVYATSTIADPGSPATQEAYSLIALLATLETLLGIITACLPMLRPVANTLWSFLPKRGKTQFTAITTTAGSIIARASHMLSLGSLSPRSITSLWFCMKRDSSERWRSCDRSEQGLVSTPEKASEEEGVEIIKTGQIHVRRDVDVESAISVHSEDAHILEFWRDSIRK